MESFSVETRAHTDFVDITRRIGEAVRKSGVDHGVAYVLVPHTTAGITVNESADPSVMRDLGGVLDRMVPWDGPYAHAEGNAAAHVKTSLMGSCVPLVVDDGELLLGRWQGVFLCEFDGPRRRTVRVKVVAG